MSEEKKFHPFRQLRNLFISGLLVIVPLVTTIWIIYAVFNFTDRNIREFLEPHFDTLCKVLFDRTFPIPPYGVGSVITILIILSAGILARNFIGRRLIATYENILLSLPVVNRIYRGIKQISESVFHRNANLFEHVVLLEYPRRGIYSIGFVTSSMPSALSSKIPEDCFCVFVSTTPNPTSGVLVIVPKKDLTILNISVEEAMNE